MANDYLTWALAMLRARRVSDAVVSRIVRLNPEPREGERLRGFHRKLTARSALHMDVCSRQVFERRWGKGSANRLALSAFVSAGGRRRFIKGMALIHGPEE